MWPRVMNDVRVAQLDIKFCHRFEIINSYYYVFIINRRIFKISFLSRFCSVPRKIETDGYLGDLDLHSIINILDILIFICIELSIEMLEMQASTGQNFKKIYFLTSQGSKSPKYVKASATNHLIFICFYKSISILWNLFYINTKTIVDDPNRRQCTLIDQVTFTFY